MLATDQTFRELSSRDQHAIAKRVELGVVDARDRARYADAALDLAARLEHRDSDAPHIFGEFDVVIGVTLDADACALCAQGVGSR